MGNDECNCLSDKVGVPNVLHSFTNVGAIVTLCDDISATIYGSKDAHPVDTEDVPAAYDFFIVTILNIAFNTDEELQVAPRISSDDSSSIVQFWVLLSM